MLGITCLLALLLGSNAQAQSNAIDDPFAGVEEMIVTGGSTAALLAPSNTSAVAFDTADLEGYGVEDLSDIAAYVPNLEIRSVNATNASFFVRGVGLQDFGANASSSVPIFQDGVPRNPSATQLVGLFDIGGLTVLKGPQGSGNYRNASAGAFLIKTQQPEPEFSGYAKVSLFQIVSVDARDAPRYDFETAVGAPVFSDWISARISARYSHENGFWENGCANRSPIDTRVAQAGGQFVPDVSICGENLQPGDISQVKPFANRWIGEVDDYGIRGQLRFNPPDIPLDLVLRGEISRLNRDSTAGQHLGTSYGGKFLYVGGGDRTGYRDPNNTARLGELTESLARERPDLYPTARFDPFVEGNVARALSRRRDRVRYGRLQKELLKRPLDEQPYFGQLDRPGRILLDTNIASMTALVDLDEFDVEVEAGYIDYRKSEGRDSDLSPNRLFPSFSRDNAWEAYGSFELSGEAIGDVPLVWSTGAYGMIEQVESKNEQFILDDFRIAEFQQEIYSFGVFAQGEYEFLEAFTLEAGIRYNWERKDFELYTERQSTLEPPPGVPPYPIIPVRSRNQRSWDAFTGFGSIRYDFTEQVSMSLKYARGFKAGHFNPSKASTARVPNVGFVDPESIDAFEWRLEFAGWADRVSGNANFFFYNYRNYQVFRLTTDATGVNRQIQNARQARNLGAELEVNILPLEGYVPEMIEGLRIKLLGGWLRTQFVEFTNAEQRLSEGIGIGTTIDYSGNPLISAPDLQFTGTFIWPIVLDRFGTFTPQYDFTWSDDTPFDPNRGRGEVDRQGNNRWSPYLVGNRAFTLHNVRLTWEPPGDTGISVAGFCRNLTDERYLTFAVDISTFNDQILNFVADPRTCGGEARFTW
jgi:outer membrane receptor protein involved in Fe transport